MANYTIDGQNFTNRRKESFDGVSLSLGGDVSNVPIRLSVTTGADTVAGYVRFTDYAGNVIQPEVEEYTASATGIYHLLIPTVYSASNANNYVWFYYNNEEGSPVDGSSASAPWDSNYKMVLHHNSNSTGSGLLDSTTNSNDLTTLGAGTPDFVTGKIGEGVEFISANSDGYQVADSASLQIDDGASGDYAATWETWVQVSGATTFAMLSKRQGNVPNRECIFILSAGAPYLELASDGSTVDTIRLIADSAIGTGAFHHVMATYDGGGSSSGMAIYVDGAAVSASTNDSGTYTYNTDTTAYLTIGAINSTGTPSYHDGKVDEQTISIGVERSADYVKVRYASGLGTWITEGSEQEGAPALTVAAYTPQTQINRMSRG